MMELLCSLSVTSCPSASKLSSDGHRKVCICVSVCLSMYVRAELPSGHVRSVLAALWYSLSLCPGSPGTDARSVACVCAGGVG